MRIYGYVRGGENPQNWLIPVCEDDCIYEKDLHRKTIEAKPVNEWKDIIFDEHFVKVDFFWLDNIFFTELDYVHITFWLWIIYFECFSVIF